MHRSRIAIVGLGVAGATAAFLLARQGHTVTLFEQCATPGPVGAGVLLQPSGQLVLERLGLLERLLPLAEPIERLHARTHYGKTLTNLPYDELAPGTRALGVHRGDLFNLLFSQVQSAGVSLRLGVRATRYLVRPTHVTLFDDANIPLQDFDYLLACDGARSALRTSSYVPFLAHEYPHGALWATGTCAAVRNELLQITHGTRHLCGVLPTRCASNPCSLFWSLRTDQRQAFFACGFDAWKSQVMTMCPQAAEIFNSVTSFDQARFTTYMHVRMPVPHDARAIFLGDAAHAMSPHLGQGINLALLDAFFFAHTLAGSETFLEACHRHTALRRRHLRFYSAVTYMLSPFFQSRGFIKAALRDVFLPLMTHIPPLRRRMIVTMAGLSASFTGGRLQLPTAGARQAQEAAS